MGGSLFGPSPFPAFGGFSGFDSGQCNKTEPNRRVSGRERERHHRRVSLQVLPHSEKWAEGSRPSPRRLLAEVAAEEAGWATFAPCPLPPNSSTAERSPRKGRCCAAGTLRRRSAG